MNEVIGMQGSKLVMGGKGFYEQCLEVALENNWISGKRYYTMRGKARYTDGNTVEPTLFLDIDLLFYSGAAVIISNN